MHYQKGESFCLAVRVCASQMGNETEMEEDPRTGACGFALQLPGGGVLGVVGTEGAGLESGEEMTPEGRVHRADFVETTADTVADGLAGFLTVTATFAGAAADAIDSG